MHISSRLTSLSFALLALPQLALSVPTPLPHHATHAEFHKMRALGRRQATAPACDTVIGQGPGVSIVIQNKSGATRKVSVTPGSDIPAAYQGELSICPGQDVTFFPGSDFHGVLHDLEGKGSMLEMNITPDGCAWWDVSLTRGQSNMIAGPAGGKMQGEADYMGKANAAWWSLPFQARQDYNYNTKYIEADGDGIKKLYMDAGDGTDPDRNVAYQNAIQFLQVDAKFNAYVARGSPWGTSPADRAADFFSQQVQNAVGSGTQFMMQLM